MRYINFLGILFCLLLNVFTLYPSESEKPGPENNSKSTLLKDFCTPFRINFLKQLIQTHRMSSEIGQEAKIPFLLNHLKGRNPEINDESIREAFYYCQDKPKDNQEAIIDLLSVIKPPFRSNFLSTMKNKPLPMERIIAQTKITIAGRPIFTGQPNPTWKILTNLDMYRSDDKNDDKNFTFTLDKVKKFIDEVTPNGKLLSLSEFSDEQLKKYGGVLIYPKFSNNWLNPLVWTCVNPLSKEQRLAITILMLKQNVDNVAIKKALMTCRRNQEYNSPIIDILEKKLAQKARDRDPDKL